MSVEKRFMHVSDTVRRVIEEGCCPSAVVEIGDANGPVWRFAEGLRKPGTDLAVNEDTRYDMASVSKIFSAAMVSLTLMEEGVISPCDGMGLFWEGLPEKAARITVQQLLTHTSGLPGGYSIVGFPKERTGEVILRSDEVLNDRRAYEPETQVQYACLGFIVLGDLLERITGKTLDALAKERVFGPLGMDSTGYAPTGDNIAFTRLDDERPGIVNDYNARYLVRPVGNAGVFSAIGDCGRFARMLLRGGEPLISRATMAMASRNYTPFSDFSRCMGFYRFGQKAQPGCQLCSPSAFGHTGWTGTSVMADPELGLYVAVLTNSTCAPHFSEDNVRRVRRCINNAAVAAWCKAI